MIGMSRTRMIGLGAVIVGVVGLGISAQGRVPVLVDDFEGYAPTSGHSWVPVAPWTGAAPYLDINGSENSPRDSGGSQSLFSEDLLSGYSVKRTDYTFTYISWELRVTDVTASYGAYNNFRDASGKAICEVNWLSNGAFIEAASGKLALPGSFPPDWTWQLFEVEIDDVNSLVRAQFGGNGWSPWYGYKDITASGPGEEMNFGSYLGVAFWDQIIVWEDEGPAPSVLLLDDFEAYAPTSGHSWVPVAPWLDNGGQLDISAGENGPSMSGTQALMSEDRLSWYGIKRIDRTATYVRWDEAVRETTWPYGTYNQFYDVAGQNICEIEWHSDGAWIEARNFAGTSVKEHLPGSFNPNWTWRVFEMQVVPDVYRVRAQFGGNGWSPWYLYKVPTASGPVEEMRFGSYLGVAFWDNIQLDSAGATCAQWPASQKPVGDINLDCVVDPNDLALLTAAWSNCNEPTDPNCLNDGVRSDPNAAKKLLAFWAYIYNDIPPYVWRLSNLIEVMEEMPFHGVIFRSVPELYWLAGAMADFSPTFDNDLAELQATNFDRFTDNFLMVRISPPYGSNKTWTDPDWGDPNDPNSLSLARNLAYMARLCKQGGLKGIWLDVEPYAAGLDFNYTDPNMQELIYQRGRQIMNAIKPEFPDIKIMTTFGLSTTLADSGEMFDALPNFLDGLLNASDPSFQLIDGYEHAYCATTLGAFQDGYTAMRDPNDQAFLQTQEDARWAAQGAAAFPFAATHCNGNENWYWQDPNFFGSNWYPPQLWEDVIGYALATSDEYVWFYPEAFTTFEDASGAGQGRPQAGFPEEYIQRTANATGLTRYRCRTDYTVTVAEDLNEDCYVNLMDFSLLADNWQACLPASDVTCP